MPPFEDARSVRRTPPLAAALTVLALALPACGSPEGSEPLDGGGTSDASGADAGGEASPPVDTGLVEVPACRSMPSICSGPRAPADCGQCNYRVVYQADRCTPETPCSEALFYWAAMGCDSERMGAFLEGLVGRHPELVTVCLQPHVPGETLPSSLGAPARDDAIVLEAMSRLRSGGDIGVWSGEALLFGGCSIGATRLPVVAARYGSDDGWVGSVKTGVCLSDGVVDVPYQRAYVEGGTTRSCAGRVGRIDRAYGSASAGLCGASDCLSWDSIVVDATPPATGLALAADVTAGDFAAPHWKLVTEGGGFSDPSTRCDRDVVAGEPFRALCAAIDADADHDCTYESFPDAPHCAEYTGRFDDICLRWFRGL